MKRRKFNSIIDIHLSGLKVTNSLLKMEVVNKFLTGDSYGIESSIITTIVFIIILLFVKNNGTYKKGIVW